MKIAGRKNDGAWYRANKYIKSLNSTQKLSLAAEMSAGAYSDAAYNDLVSLATELNIDSGDIPANVNDWCSTMANYGIPRQIWYGRLSFTTYGLSETSEPPALRANYQSNIHYFAKELRKLMKNQAFGTREISDVFNRGDHNPGGWPNVDPET